MVWQGQLLLEMSNYVHLENQWQLMANEAAMVWYKVYQVRPHKKAIDIYPGQQTKLGWS